MGSKNSAPPPPDYSGVIAASEAASQRSFQLGQDQLAWAKQQYAQDRQISDKVVDSFLSAQQDNQQAARKDRARYEQIYQPLENQLVKDAQSYASPERKELEMGRAQSAVSQQFGAARQNAERQLEAFGVNPSSTRYAALDIGTRSQQAAASAAAGNQASQMVDATGRALRSEALNIGRGYPGQVAGTYSTAMQAGSGAVNSQLATTASGANTMGTAPQYMGLGNQALGVWGSTLNASYQNQLAQWQANNQSSSGWGSALGLIGGILPAFFAEGGAVPEAPQQGGAIPVPTAASPSAGRAIDDIPARLTPGEMVVDRDTTSWYGEKFFQDLVKKARKDRVEAPAKPTVGPAAPAAPTFSSRAALQQRALPMAP